MSDPVAPHRSSPAWARLLLPAAVPLTVGGALGLAAGVAHGEGGMNGLFAFASVLGIFVLLLGLVLLIGLGNLVRREGKGRTAARLSFSAAGLLAAGGSLAYGAALLLNLGYVEPVQAEPTPTPRQAAVVLHLEDEAGSAPDPDWDTSTADGRGTCPFEDDGSVRLVSAEQVGSLLGSPMKALVDLPHQPHVRQVVTISLEVERGASWWGPAVLAELGPGGISGRAQFINLAGWGGNPAGWPHYLRGELSWVCA